MCACIRVLRAQMMRRMPVAVGLVALPSLIMLCVAPLACYHCSLVCANKTTSEEIKDVRASTPRTGTGMPADDDAVAA